MGMLKILKGKNKKKGLKPSGNFESPCEITKKQYKEIKKRACPWKFLMVEDSKTNSYLSHDILVYSYVQNNGIQQLRFQNKKGKKVSTQTQLPFYYSKPFCISEEFYYYEITLVKNKDSNIYFGLGLSSYLLSDLPGTTTGTVGYNNSGLIYANGSVVAYAQVIKEGDTVGIGYYPTNGNIFFTLNGNFVQTLSESILHKQRFFPHLGSDGECTLDVNFGITHFTYKPNENNKYLTTEELNNKNIKQNDFNIDESVNDSSFSFPKETNTSTSKVNILNDPYSTETTNNISYIENVNKKIDNSNIDFFESIDNANTNYTTNINTQGLQHSSSTLSTDLSSFKYTSLPSSSSTIFNNNNNNNNNNFGSNSTLFPITESDYSNALVPVSSTNTLTTSPNIANPFSMYMNNSNNNANNYNNYSNYNYNSSYTTNSSYNPNNPFNSVVSNSNLLMSSNTSFSNNNNNNNIGFNNNISNNFITNPFNNNSNNNNTFNNNYLLQNNSMTTSWMPTSSIATSVQNNMDSLAVTSTSSPMLDITRTFSLNDNDKKSSFNYMNNTNNVNNNNGTKHLSVNAMLPMTSPPSLTFNNTSNNGNDTITTPFNINTSPSSPVLSNISSNLSSPINSPFNSSFHSPSIANSNTNINNPNDLFNSNNNALANTSLDSSFSLNGNALGSNNSNNHNKNNSIFNMNNIITANNAIIDELNNNNNKNTSPYMTPTSPSALSVQRSSSLLKNSLTLNIASTSTVASNPFSSPVIAGSPTSLSNPFTTPTSPVKPLETSSIQSAGLSYHPPIVSSSSSSMIATKSVSSWENIFNTDNNFNSSSSMVNNSSGSMVATNLTGAQSIHSTTRNPFEGIH